MTTIEKPIDTFAVPLPKHPIAPFCSWHSAELRAIKSYGDAREAAAPHALREKLRSCEEALAAAEAREAAGRAVAVPEGYCLMPMKGTPEIFTAMRMSVGDGVAMGPVYYAALSAGAIAAPTHQQPAAEGVGREAVAWQYRDAKWKPGVWADITRAMYDGYKDGNATGKRGKDWDIRELYDSPTPAADAGGVTLEYADRVLSEYVRIQINEHTDRATEEHRVDAMRRALTAALQEDSP